MTFFLTARRCTFLLPLLAALGFISNAELASSAPAGPTLSQVTIASNNPNAAARARVGDLVTVSFTASEPIGDPTMTVLGQSATLARVSPTEWSGSRTVTAATPAGTAAFSIAYQDLAGNAGTTVTTTSDGSAVTVDKVTLTPTTSTPSGKIVSTSLGVTFNLPEAPLPGSAKLIFNDYGNSTVASTLTLAAAQEVAGNRTVNFNPADPTASAAIGSGAALPDGDYGLTISYQDAAGNVAATVKIAFFRIDSSVPVITAATFALPAKGWAKDGTDVGIRFVTSEDHLSTVTVSIAGLAPVAVNPDARSYITHVTPAYPEGAITFSLKVTDQAGNVSAPVTATTDGSVVKVDRTAPVATVPAPITAEATRPEGTAVTYTIGITDNLDPAPTLRDFGPKSGDVFPLGETTVYARVYDAAGNEVHEPFTVTVVDTTAPAVAAIPEQTVAAGDTGTASLPDFTATVRALATDAVGVTTVEQTPAPGTVLGLGRHTVAFAVKDAAGNATTAPAAVVVTFERATAPGKTTVGGHSGQLAPAGPPAGTKLSTFGTPAISDSRDLAAKVGMLDGRRKLAGICVEDGAGKASLAAYQGGPVPGIATEGVTFKSFLDPVLAPGGAIAFAGTVQGGGVKGTEDQGLWTDAFTGSLELALREGSEVPGLPAGSKLKAVTSISLLDGELLALVTLKPEPGTVTARNDTVLLRMTGPTAARVLLREGENPPGWGNAVVKTMSVLQPAQFSAGQGRWHLPGAVLAKVTTADGSVWVFKLPSAGGAGELLLTTDEDVADAGLPASAGEAFAARVTLRLGNGVTRPFDEVIKCSYGPDLPGNWLQEGLLPLGPDLPVQYASFADPVVNDQDLVLFLASLRGPGVTARNGQALWTVRPNAEYPMLARLGEAAPDKEGAPLNGAVWSAFTTYALPDGPGSGPVFLATLSGPGVTAKDKTGLWAVDSKGKLRLLLRTNDDVPVDGTNRKLANLTLLNALPGSFGARRSYNSTGSLAVLATFTDKTQALLRVDIP